MISLTHRQEWILILLSYADSDKRNSVVGSMTAGDILQAFRRYLCPAADSTFVNPEDLFSELRLLVSQGFVDLLLSQSKSEQTLKGYYRITDQGIDALVQLGLLNSDVKRLL